jgi:hypothetical protein
VFSTNELYDNYGGDGKSEAKEEGGKHDLEPLTKFAKAHPALKNCSNMRLHTHTHSNVGHDKQNTLNLELCYFIWNIQFQTQKLSITDLFAYKY